MSYLPDEFEVVFPTAASQAFWDACNDQRLAFQQCTACRTFRHPPGPLCHACQSDDYAWTEVSGDGTLFSWTVVTHPVHPSLAERVPFNVALVEFADAPGVRLISNVVDAAPEELTAGMPLRLHWDKGSNGQLLPRFVKA